MAGADIETVNVSPQADYHHTPPIALASSAVLMDLSLVLHGGLPFRHHGCDHFVFRTESARVDNHHEALHLA